MNQLRKLETSEITQLREAMLSYYGYIISSQHGIIHIGNTKNRISALQEKAARLKEAGKIRPIEEATLKGCEKELTGLQAIIEDIQNEIIGSQDPRSMLNLKTLEATRRVKELMHDERVAKLSSTSTSIHDIIKDSASSLAQQLKSLEIMIALMS